MARRTITPQELFARLPKKRRNPLSLAERTVAARRALSGESRDQLASEFGVTLQTVNYWAGCYERQCGPWYEHQHRKQQSLRVVLQAVH